MSERPRCDLGHELDFIGHNHVDPDEYLEHVEVVDLVGRAAVERQIAARKAYIRDFNAARARD